MNGIRSQRGQAMVMSVVFLVVLLGMGALVLDVGSWYRADRDAQIAADAAALAGAQGLAESQGRATDLATEYTTKNGGGLAPGGITFPSSDTVRVTIERPAPGFFAKLFSIDAVTVHATAAARVGSPAQAKYVAPIVVNEQHPKLQCQPSPCFNDPTELDYYHLKTGGNGKDDPPDGAGSFGFINLVQGGGNPGVSDLGTWIRYGLDAYMPLGNYDARTGNPFSSSNVGAELQGRVGEELLFPIYRKLTATGSNAKYEIVGWVGFHLTGMNLTGNNEKLYGYFTQVIWQGLQGSTGGVVAPGVKVVQLVD